MGPLYQRLTRSMSNRKEWREERNLESQWEAAKWTKEAAFAAKYAAWAAWAAVAVTVIGVYLVYRTLLATRAMLDEAQTVTGVTRLMLIEAENTTRAAERSADIQLDAYRRLERPYLYVEVVRTDGLKPKNPQQRHPSLDYRIVNHGKTPAIIVSTSVGLLFNPKEPVTSTGELSKGQYYVLIPGDFSQKDEVIVRGEESARQFTGNLATRLILVAHFEYQDQSGVTFTDWMQLRGNANGDSFKLETIRRATDFVHGSTNFS